MAGEKVPFKWDNANFTWNNNPYTWNDVALAAELAGGGSYEEIFVRDKK